MAPHEADGWYIEPSLEHYRCVGFYIPSSHSTQIADTAEFLPAVFPLLKTSSEDYLHQPIGDIITLLADPKPTAPPLSLRKDTQNPIKLIATLLNRAIPAPQDVETPLPPPSPHPTLPS